MKIYLKNMQELREQLGLNKAKEVFEKLHEAAIGFPEFISIPCSDNSEAIALFELNGLVAGKTYYEFTGTAN